MKGVSGRRSIGDAQCSPLPRVPICLGLGARQDETVLDHVHAVVVAAVAEGVIDDVRLGEAAARAAVGAWRPRLHGGDAALGPLAARKALRVRSGRRIAPRLPRRRGPTAARHRGRRRPVGAGGGPRRGRSGDNGHRAAREGQRGRGTCGSGLAAPGRRDPGPAPPPLAARPGAPARRRPAGRSSSTWAGRAVSVCWARP